MLTTGGILGLMRLDFLSVCESASQVTQVSRFNERMKLNDARFQDIVAEPWWERSTTAMTTLFPRMILRKHVNSVSTRHIRWRRAFDFVWTHFGFADDSPEMTERRSRQAYFFGPAQISSGNALV